MGPPVRPGYRKWPHRSAANGGREMSRWVKVGKPQAEHMSSGLPSIADMERKCWHVREVPITDIAPGASATAAIHAVRIQCPSKAGRLPPTGALGDLRVHNPCLNKNLGTTPCPLRRGSKQQLSRHKEQDRSQHEPERQGREADRHVAAEGN